MSRDYIGAWNIAIKYNFFDYRDLEKVFDELEQSFDGFFRVKEVEFTKPASNFKSLSGVEFFKAIEDESLRIEWQKANIENYREIINILDLQKINFKSVHPFYRGSIPFFFYGKTRIFENNSLVWINNGLEIDF